jgi:phosphoribosylamine--glycine ligase / phosphoribosylformylglycinamidine cyclo-ligase
MEGSKAFAKDFMARHHIPTAAFKVFKADELDAAIQYVQTCGHRVVLKASGLAAGKGVLIPETIEETVTGLREIMVDSVFGSAGPRPLPCTRGASVIEYTSSVSRLQAMRSLSRNY